MNSNKISCSVLYLHSKLQHAYVNCNRNQIEILLFFDLFLRGCMAAFKSSSFDFRPRQLPTMLSIQIEFITLNVSVFLINSATVGFWLALPACRCMPKNFSMGS